MVRQIAGSFAEYEKRRLVCKLREARERLGKLGGRKSYAEALRRLSPLIFPQWHRERSIRCLEGRDPSDPLGFVRRQTLLRAKLLLYKSVAD